MTALQHVLGYVSFSIVCGALAELLLPGLIGAVFGAILERLR